MSRSGREYLQHILDETNYLLQVSANITLAHFLADETLKRAFVRSLEIIGEAVKQLPEELRQKYAHVSWRSMAAMRDRLIHGYFGVDYDIVWDVVIRHIPQLRKDILAILSQEYS